MTFALEKNMKIQSKIRAVFQAGESGGSSRSLTAFRFAYVLLACSSEGEEVLELSRWRRSALRGANAATVSRWGLAVRSVCHLSVLSVKFHCLL